MILDIARKFIFIAGILMLMNCGGGGGDTPPPPPPPKGSVKLQNNNSTLPIAEFYLTPSSQTSWGINQLLDPVSAGTYYNILNVPVETYDAYARVYGTLSTYVAYLFGMSVTDGNIYTVYSTDSNYTGSFKVVNTSVTASVIGLYIVPPAATDWGNNQLSSAIVPSGSMHLFDMLPGTYDVRVVWEGDVIVDYPAGVVKSLTLLTLKAVHP